MKNIREIRNIIFEETMPYALDDKGRIGIDDEDAIENINSLLSGITAGGFQTPYIALEKVRKTLANFHIHLPKVTFDDGDNDHFTFEITQFGNKMGMTNNGEFVKNDSSPYYLYFEYSLNGMGNYNIFAEIVNEEDLAELMQGEDSDEEEDDDDDSEIQGADQNQSYDTNQDEHKGMRMTEDRQTDVIKGMKAKYMLKDIKKSGQKKSPELIKKLQDKADKLSLKEHLAQRGWKFIKD